MAGWTERMISVAGTNLFYTRGGSGPPLVLLHRDIGPEPTLAFYDRLAEHFDVIFPHHPGFNRSERPAWLRSVRDVAVMYQMLLVELRVNARALLGLGFGGWIAAEMASMAPRDVTHMALVAPMGIKPPEGFIYDQALVGYPDYIKAGLHDEAVYARQWGAEPAVELLEQWDINREMCFRIAWKPYMYSQTLPHLLENVRVPTILYWGDDDRIVPRSTASVWIEAMRHARLEILPSCGHLAEIERGDSLAEQVISFLQD